MKIAQTRYNTHEIATSVQTLPLDRGNYLATLTDDTNNFHGSQNSLSILETGFGHCKFRRQNYSNYYKLIIF